MAYIPGASYRKGSYGKTGTVYASRREVKEKPQVSFSYADRVKSEGLSRELAESLIRSFDTAGLAVHPDKPVREKVIRKRREWVPAVLRYNTVPAQVLLEVCNLSNSEDRELIQTREFRQKVAERIVQGIVDYYGNSTASDGMKVALTSGR
jgi:N-acetylmuramoyl-L-alanine amidase